MQSNSTVRTVRDARTENFARKEARIDAIQRKTTQEMSDADAQSLAATDPRIGVLTRCKRGGRSFQIFYAWVDGGTVESRDIADIVRALAEGGAA